MKKESEGTVEIAVERETFAQFKEAAGRHGRSAEELLNCFMKDYIVSDGHPEQISGGQPWNRKD